MTALERAAELRAGFEAAGATPVDLPILQPAETLLDLYGEDIRGRAFVTSDAVRGEQMLRPDFTVPVAQMHLNRGARQARYTYAGPVFRKQDQNLDRPSEYLQVGYEVFQSDDPAGADAEVFAAMSRAVAGLPVRAVTGDIGVLMAAVQGLETTPARRAALMRHIWRPTRFRALLDRFGGQVDPHPSRAAMLAGETATDAPLNGRRGADEIAARLAALAEDAQTPPINHSDLTGLEALLAVKAPLTRALTELHEIAETLPPIRPAITRLSARAEALKDRGIAVDDLAFEASYGRTSMEYYDGFVFGIMATDAPDLAPVATGGRYDALTRRLGGDRAVPAVGGVLRPAEILALEAGT